MNNRNFTKEQVIEIGNRLANAGLVVKYAARSHSHNCFVLFPQTEAQYNWLKRNYGTTSNLCITNTVEEVLTVCPELSGYVKQTKSNRFCRISISL